ncbi:hypothetical protein QVD17_28603 [Tagetes erecta]|uniref:Uncharacterized protein n=1 Tax=Tagetes erecta TaxID=13708 RepID=A0AAD8KDN8_TARER|nr:hypothetical protein QVD17_28603 [Tagetes erecta]
MPSQLQPSPLSHLAHHHRRPPRILLLPTTAGVLHAFSSCSLGKKRNMSKRGLGDEVNEDFNQLQAASTTLKAVSSATKTKRINYSKVGVSTGTSGHCPSFIPARYINSDQTLIICTLSMVLHNLFQSF